MAIVARLLRGEPLELVARETNVSIARLTRWRDNDIGRRGYEPWKNVSAMTATMRSPG